MEGPGEPTAPPQRPAGAKPVRARRSGPAHLHVVPVDATRLFVHWFVPADQLRRALTQLAGERAGARLRLRILDVLPGREPTLASEPRQELAAGGGWHEGFVTLDRPGGSIVAALGIQDGRGEFSALLTSLVVNLADPAVSTATTTAAPPKEQNIPQLGAGQIARLRQPGDLTIARSRRGGPEPSLKSVLARVKNPRGPGEELKLEETNGAPAAAPPAPVLSATQTAPPAGQHPEVTSTETPVAIAPTREPELPEETPESRPEPAVTPSEPTAPEQVTPVEQPPKEPVEVSPVVFEAQIHEQEATPADVQPATAEEPAATSAAPASDRLASYFDAPSGAPDTFIDARLVITGRLADGHRLWIGNEEVEPRPGGSFSYRKALDGAPLAWAFLLHVASMDESLSVPSIEVIAAQSEQPAVMTMHVSIEIEGRLESPSHRELLPPGMHADAQGRFAIVRQLPAGAWFLPQVVLTARS